MTRFACAVTIASLLAAVACSGGGNGQPSRLVPSSAPGAQTQSISLDLANRTPNALPNINGTTGTITLTPNNAPPGSKLIVGLSAGSPANMPSVPAPSASALEYFSLTPSADVTFKGSPTIALTLPTVPKSQGQFYAWMYSLATNQWTSLGPITVSRNVVAFGGGSASLSMKRGSTYVVVPFTAKPAAACPTPTPSPIPTPTRGPVPTGEKLYATTASLLNPAKPISGVAVFDPQGSPISPIGDFPNVDEPTGMAFDSANQHLYVVNPGNNTITVYDENGRRISTVGNFPNLDATLGASITFDSVNQRLYVANFQNSSITVYDAAGHQVAVSGSFPNLDLPFSITFDSSNCLLYVANSNVSFPVLVYDQNGDPIKTTGAFPPPALNATPTGIGFEPSRKELYAWYVLPVNKIVVYDENGDEVRTFPATSMCCSVGSIAFDPVNHLVYTYQILGISIYDRNGNPLPATGNFPFVGNAGG